MCVIVNVITPESIIKFLWQQDMVISWDDFENGCIPMHCGAHGVRRSVYIVGRPTTLFNRSLLCV